MTITSRLAPTTSRLDHRLDTGDHGGSAFGAYVLGLAFAAALNAPVEEAPRFGVFRM